MKTAYKPSREIARVAAQNIRNAKRANLWRERQQRFVVESDTEDYLSWIDVRAKQCQFTRRQAG